MLSSSHTIFLRDAAAYLESPSYLTKLADAVGGPLQRIVEKVVPDRVKVIGNKALQGAMTIAADSVMRTPVSTDFDQAIRVSDQTGFWHRFAATVTGAAAGSFGYTAMAIELPVTTGLMFRSIASIAHDLGEDLSTPEARLECITVFSHGGPSPDDDAMDASYITARVAMTKLLRDAAEFMAAKSSQALVEAFATGTAPAMLALISRIAVRFNVVVSQKFLAQCIPIVGIATGAAINNAFAGHFNTVARYHFGIRRLQRQYGADEVFAEYRRQLEQVRGTPAQRRPDEGMGGALASA